MKKTISPKTIALTFSILALTFLVSFYVIAWTEPGQAPPEGNVASPLNTGDVGQIKEGNLVVNALGISGTGDNLFIMPAGAGAGRVLTSDASGVGTWKAPTVSSGPNASYGLCRETYNYYFGSSYLASCHKVLSPAYCNSSNHCWCEGGNEYNLQQIGETMYYVFKRQYSFDDPTIWEDKRIMWYSCFK
ncbi:MAG: hypothetical protein ABH952_05510 [Candidatus Omnitrophota bacterium]